MQTTLFKYSIWEMFGPKGALWLSAFDNDNSMHSPINIQNFF